MSEHTFTGSPMWTYSSGTMDLRDWFATQYADTSDADADIPLKLRWIPPDTVKVEHLKAAKESLRRIREAHRI